MKSLFIIIIHYEYCHGFSTLRKLYVEKVNYVDLGQHRIIYNALRLNVGKIKVDIGIHYTFNLNRYTLNNAEALNVN